MPRGRTLPRQRRPKDWTPSGPAKARSRPPTGPTEAQYAAAAAERKRRLQAMRGQKKDRDRRAAAAAAERQRRLQTMRSRRVQHTVAKGEGIEEIGQQYGLEGKEALDQLKGVERLRPGQILTLDTPVAEYTGAGRITPDPIRREKEYSGAGAVYGSRADRLAEKRKYLQEEYGISPPGGYIDDPGGIGYRSSAAEVGPQDASPEAWQRATEEPYTQDQFERTSVRPAIDKLKREEAMRYGNFADTMRYTAQSLQMAYMTGDRDWLPDYLTDYMMAQFSPEELEKIIAMGYYQDESGIWIPLDVEEADYGMGGYGYGGGYGGGGGGGGGYKEKTYTKGGSSARGGRTGGRTKMDVKRLFVDYMSHTKWRI